MSTVLGVYAGHDPGACLLRDGRIVVAIEEERLTRVKHGLPATVRGLWPAFNGRFGYFPWASLSYCLQAAGLGIDELDALVLSEDAEQADLASILPIKDKSKVIVASEPSGGAHHHRHALTAFHASPFEQAAVLVIDGDGTHDAGGYEAESGYLFSDRCAPPRAVFKNRYSLDAELRSGLGWTYDYVSAALGFAATEIGYLSQPGKTMGLAPYGGPSAELADPWIRREGFRLDFGALHAWLRGTGTTKRLRFDTREFALIGSEDAIPQHAKDLAWKVQHELEESVLHLARELHAATGAKALCLAGGVALNSVANGRLRREGPFEALFVQPAADDRGQAIGLAYQGHLLLGRDAQAPRTRIASIAHAYGGRTYPAPEVARLLERGGLSSVELDEAALVAAASTRLARGEVLGWFQGGSELGPRSLGHRSILADPRPADMKERLNARVKFRESFRPFAPSVLASRAAEVFELEGESPYMLEVAAVREAWRERVPAITHVDGTARVQTVTPEAQPRFHALITAFEAATQVPLLLNTSFNLRGMPIVESPLDALRCFLYTELDALYLGGHEVERPPPTRLCPRVARGWHLVVESCFAPSGPSQSVRFESTSDKRSVDVRPLPELVALLRALDGKRNLADAMVIAAGEPPSPEVAHALGAFVRLLLRQGPLTLCVGDLQL